MAVNWELQGCCDRDQRIFIAAVGVSTIVILLVSTTSPTPSHLLSVSLWLTLYDSPRRSDRGAS
jgi:hypothetical protein